MAKKKVDVEIGAKNKMMSGLRGATQSLRKFGRSAGKLMKNVAKGVAVAGVAILAVSVKMVKAWSVQESAEKSLSEALLAQGDSVDTLMVKYKKLASAIQDETGVGDESTLALIAKLRTIGVTNAKMEDAVKLTMALSKAGMREKTAFRAAADAMNGNTTALTTYIPELRQATTQAEKMAVVNSLAVRGYKQLSGELDTNAGRWTELKGRLGDVFERIGKVISGGLDLKDTMAKLSDKIKAFGSSSKFDAFLKKMKTAITDVKNLIKVLAGGGEAAGEAMKKLGDVLRAAFWVAGEKVAAILKTAAPEIGRLIAKGMKSLVFGSREARIRRGQAIDTVAAEMREEKKARIKAGTEPFFSPSTTKEFGQRVDELFATLTKEAAAERGRLIETKGLTPAEANFKDTLDKLRKSLPASKPAATNFDSLMPTISYFKSFKAPDVKLGPRVSRTTGNNTDDGSNVIGGATSMLSISDLYTMMQTGGSAKATVLSENQKQTAILQEQLDEMKKEGIS